MPSWNNVIKTEVLAMIESDTIKLLRECDAGVKMGVSTLEDSKTYAKSRELRAIINSSKREHDKIKTELNGMLRSFGDSGKEPPAMAKGMAWVKTNFVLASEATDSAVSSFITDGCNMGIKSLSKYLNRYKAADERSKDLAKRLVRIEDELIGDVRKYL